jgi:hypothetical protein
MIPAAKGAGYFKNLDTFLVSMIFLSLTLFAAFLI